MMNQICANWRPEEGNKYQRDPARVFGACACKRKDAALKAMLDAAAKQDAANIQLLWEEDGRAGRRAGRRR
jgi:hypothetical protein